MWTLTERRAYVRFKIPGAKVSFSQEAWLNQTEKIDGEGTLKDITIKSARFETTQNNLQVGARIHINLIIPNQETLTIKGNIIHCKKDVAPGANDIVVEFISYGPSKDFNSESVKEALLEMAKEYFKPAS